MIEADENFDKLNDHFGLAAEPYASALLEQLEWAMSASTLDQAHRHRGRRWPV